VVAKRGEDGFSNGRWGSSWKQGRAKCMSVCLARTTLLPFGPYYDDTSYKYPVFIIEGYLNHAEMARPLPDREIIINIDDSPGGLFNYYHFIGQTKTNDSGYFMTMIPTGEICNFDPRDMDIAIRVAHRCESNYGASSDFDDFNYYICPLCTPVCYGF
jgi:hypothetical protein